MTKVPSNVTVNGREISVMAATPEHMERVDAAIHAVLALLPTYECVTIQPSDIKQENGKGIVIGYFIADKSLLPSVMQQLSADAGVMDAIATAQDVAEMPSKDRLN